RTPNCGFHFIQTSHATMPKLQQSLPASLQWCNAFSNNDALVLPQ
ncbi:hypothetical protein JL09_g5922, partial [Pichia kudriavzevii]